MENKLTAVEFLADNLHYLHSTKWDDILIKAKEMEKEQILNAFDDGWDSGHDDAMYENPLYTCKEDYYNDIFNK